MAIKSFGPFTGFEEEALQFLKKLKKNNKREWFLPRKAFFEERVQTPMALLMFALERELQQRQVPLATCPKGTLYRIYRDVRFSADKRPYNSHVSGSLYRNGKKGAPGVVYMHVGDNEQFTAAGFWQPERAELVKWRLKMQAEPDQFLAVVKRLKSKKLELATSHALQRMPRGFQTMEASPIAEFLRLQSFVVTRQLSPADVLSAELPKQLARFALDALPLLEYGWALPQTKPTMFAD